MAKHVSKQSLEHARAESDITRTFDQDGNIREEKEQRVTLTEKFTQEQAIERCVTNYKTEETKRLCRGLPHDEIGHASPAIRLAARHCDYVFDDAAGWDADFMGTVNDNVAVLVKKHQQVIDVGTLIPTQLAIKLERAALTLRTSLGNEHPLSKLYSDVARDFKTFLWTLLEALPIWPIHQPVTAPDTSVRKNICTIFTGVQPPGRTEDWLSGLNGDIFAKLAGVIGWDENWMWAMLTVINDLQTGHAEQLLRILVISSQLRLRIAHNQNLSTFPILIESFLPSARPPPILHYMSPCVSNHGSGTREHYEATVIARFGGCFSSPIYLPNPFMEVLLRSVDTEDMLISYRKQRAAAFRTIVHERYKRMQLSCGQSFHNVPCDDTLLEHEAMQPVVAMMNSRQEIREIAN